MPTRRTRSARALAANITAAKAVIAIITAPRRTAGSIFARLGDDDDQRRSASSAVDLTARARQLATRYGLPAPLSIRWSERQEWRWGSCTPADGTVRISTRLAREPAWVSITDVDGRHLYVGVMQANETRSIDLTKGATLRTGNAGGLIVRFNGKEIGAIGPAGKIRDVEFQNGAFRIL